jgi:hypothetical protein
LRGRGSITGFAEPGMAKVELAGRGTEGPVLVLFPADQACAAILAFLEHNLTPSDGLSWVSVGFRRVYCVRLEVVLAG